MSAEEWLAAHDSAVSEYRKGLAEIRGLCVPDSDQRIAKLRDAALAKLRALGITEGDALRCLRMR